MLLTSRFNLENKKDSCEILTLKIIGVERLIARE